MSYRRNPTEVSLRGSLCRDLLEMVASGMSANEAAQKLISQLLTAPSPQCSVRLVSGVFVFEKAGDAGQRTSQPYLLQ